MKSNKKLIVIKILFLLNLFFFIPICSAESNLDDLISRYNTVTSSQKIPSRQLLIFVSFSMPDASLKAWLQQSQKAGGILIIRGLIDHSFKKTALAVQNLIGQNQTGIEIDPTLFERFQIQEVPAVVVTATPVMPCSTSGCDQVPFDVVYGDMSLDAALNELANKGTDSQNQASMFLQKLRSAP